MVHHLNDGTVGFTCVVNSRRSGASLRTFLSKYLYATYSRLRVWGTAALLKCPPLLKLWAFLFRLLSFGATMDKPGICNRINLDIRWVTGNRNPVHRQLTHSLKSVTRWILTGLKSKLLIDIRQKAHQFEKWNIGLLPESPFSYSRESLSPKTEIGKPENY